MKLGTSSAWPACMVRLTVAFQAASARSTQEFLDSLRFLSMGTRLEPGCLVCTVWSDFDSLHYLEEWATEADLRRHVCSDRFTSLLLVVEAAKHPRVQFDFVTTTRGLDYVAEVRGEPVN